MTVQVYPGPHLTTSRGETISMVDMPDTPGAGAEMCGHCGAWTWRLYEHSDGAQVWACELLCARRYFRRLERPRDDHTDLKRRAEDRQHRAERGEARVTLGASNAKLHFMMGREDP